VKTNGKRTCEVCGIAFNENSEFCPVCAFGVHSRTSLAEPFVVQFKNVGDKPRRIQVLCGSTRVVRTLAPGHRRELPIEGDVDLRFWPKKWTHQINRSINCPSSNQKPS
jgi:hypothetical protein